MKVLLVFPMKDRQTGLFICRAFEELGCEVHTVDAKIRPNLTLHQAKKLQPDLLFCSRTKALTSSMPHIKSVSPKTITVCWNVDKRNDVKEEFDPQLIKLFGMVDIFYTIAKGNVKQYSKILPKTTKVKHLQQGCDLQAHYIPEVTKKDMRNYGCEVMFAGSMASCGRAYVRSQRLSLLNHLNEKFDLKVYGPGSRIPKGAHFTASPRIMDLPLHKAHRCSKVVLGHNGWPDVDISMSVRDYKIMATGGFLLTQHCRGIGKWFEIGKMCETYETNEECEDKIRYYLEHEDERLEIVNYGYRMTREKHKYVDRMRQVLENVKAIR